MNEVASVTTKEFSLNLMMMKPLKKPAAMPTSRASGTPTQGDQPMVSIAQPPTTTDSPPMAPKERFMPPITTTMACPMATKT